MSNVIHRIRIDIGGNILEVTFTDTYYMLQIIHAFAAGVATVEKAKPQPQPVALPYGPATYS